MNAPHPLLPTDDAAWRAALQRAASADTPPAEGLVAAEAAAAQAAADGHALREAEAQAWACGHLMRLGRHAETLDRAAAVLPQLPAGSAVRSELLRCVTLAGADTGRFAVALDAAHELSRQAHEEHDLDSVLGGAYALAVCLERLGDAWQALRVLSDALAAVGQACASRPLLVATNAACAIGIGMAHELRDLDADGERDSMLADAQRHGERALAMLAEVPDTAYEVAVPGNLGEVLVLAGQTARGRSLLARSLALAEARGLQAHAWRIRASLAIADLAEARPAEALATTEQLLKDMGPLAPPQTAIRAHTVAATAAHHLGRHAEAYRHLAAVERMERERSIAQLRSQSSLYVTRTEAERARADARAHRETAAAWAAEAERDALTGLGNRRLLDRRWRELSQGLAEQPLSLALIDIDHFKRINDGHGHAVGDRVLMVMAQLLRENTRAGDVLVRLGGEEFVMLLPGMARERAAEVCERLRERLARLDWPARAGRAMAVTVSIGLVTSPPLDLPALLAAADAALYRAKAGGRDRLVLADLPIPGV